jgi:ABC-2 type transport system permease protein
MNPGSLPAGAPRPVRTYGPVNWMGLWSLTRGEIRAYLSEWVETVIGPTFNTLVYLAIFMVAVGTGTAEGRRIVDFVIPGVILFTLIVRATETTNFSLTFRKLEHLTGDFLMPPLSAFEIMAGFTLSGMASGLLTGVPCLIAVLLLFRPDIAAPALLPLYAGLTALLMALIGILIGLWAEKWDQAGGAFALVLVPVTVVSGLFAPVDRLPGPIHLIAVLNPIYYGIDGFRAGFLGQGDVPVALSLAVLVVSVAALGLIAHMLIRRGWKLKA